MQFLFLPKPKEMSVFRPKESWGCRAECQMWCRTRQCALVCLRLVSCGKILATVEKTVIKGGQGT